MSASPKRRLLEHPSGVLLITPESIESLFVNHAHRLEMVFPSLAFIVIDELHSFIGTERGAHLRSLIYRLGSKSRMPVRRVGLSATFGPDVSAIRRWLRPMTLKAYMSSKIPAPKPIQLRNLRLFATSKPRLSEDGSRCASNHRRRSRLSLERDVFDAFNGKTALIFINAKKEIEEIADYVERNPSARRVPNSFRVHHGSLSKGEQRKPKRP